GRFRFLLVDEYQDTNAMQLRLVRLLSARHQNVCAVGDDDQSIYSWRGAQAANLLEFEQHFPGARVVKLEENYRSRPAILDAANAVIQHAARRHEKKLWTRRAPGAPLRLVVLEDAEAEARYVATEIAALGVAPGEAAVLYRSNLQARPLEDALREAGLRYRVIGGQEVLERQGEKEVLGRVRAALSPTRGSSPRRLVKYP